MARQFSDGGLFSPVFVNSGTTRQYLLRASLINEVNTSAAPYTLTAAVGAFSITGVAAVLKATRQLPVTVGAYSITGNSAALTWSGAPVVTRRGGGGRFGGMGAGYGRLGATRAPFSGSSASVPSGALGIWYAADAVTSPRAMIKNSVSNAAGNMDPNILIGPRRVFSSSMYSLGAGTTVVDSDNVAPDGSTEASSVNSSAGVSWSITASAPLTAGTYTAAISVKWLGAGSADFRMGDGSSPASKTATGSWARYTATFTKGSAGTVSIVFQSPGGGSQANFAIADLQLFSGISDLNTTWNTLKPLSIRNADLMVGTHGNNQTVGSVSGGVIVWGSNGLVQFNSFTPSQYSLFYVAKKNASGQQGTWQSILASADVGGLQWQNFAVGPRINGNVGARLPSTTMDPATTATPRIASNDGLWGGAGFGPFVAVHTFNGTTSAGFMNGVKLLGTTQSPIAVSSADLWYGQGINGGSSFRTAYETNVLGVYDTGLSDTNARLINTVFKTQFSVPTHRIVAFEGTSITNGTGGTSGLDYPQQAALLTTTKNFGANFGIAGSTMATITARSSYMDALLTPTPSQTMILHLEVGANDTTNATFLTNLASYCDARRAAGFKVILATILPQNDGTFNTNRNSANTTIRTWVGVHVDAIDDWAADATIGTDAAGSDVLKYGDGKHPTPATYAAMAAITGAAIDSI